MTTAAFIGSQTLLQLGDAASPTAYTTIGEVTDIGPLAQKKDLIEVTHLLSTAKEFIGGLSEGQEISIDCNYIPDNVNQMALITAAGTASAAKHFKYISPATASGGAKTFTFDAIVLGSGIGPTTPNTATKINFSLKISGPIV